MNLERWARVKELFDLAVDLPPLERERILNSACPDDAGLRLEVEALIRRSSQLGAFLECPAADGFAAGTLVLDRFEIVALLGEGGMGEVYRARDLHLDGTPVALKTIRVALARDPRQIARLRKELLMAREIVHSNVCPIYDYFEAENNGVPVRFITMRFLEGETLRSRLQREGPLSKDVALPLVDQICAGLEAAHSAGILHGDLKASNVMLIQREGGTLAVLTDFGLARTFEEGGQAGQSTGVFGTPAYMSPEALQHAPLSPASDIYSLGILLNEMRTGRTSTSDSVESLEPSWRRTISSCLEHRPEKRPSTAREVAAALRRRVILFPLRAMGWVAAALVVGAALWAALPGVRKVVTREFSSVPKLRHVALLPMEAGGPEDLLQIARAQDDQIAARLARAEARDPDFWIVSAADLEAQKSTSIDTAGRSFPVNLALRTSLSRDSRKIRASLDLVLVKSKKSVVSREIVCPLDEVFRLSELMVAQIADILNLEASLATGADPGTDVAEAYRSYEAGRSEMTARTLEATDKALKEFSKAAELDAHFALAYAALADGYSRKYAFTKEPAFVSLAQQNAERAVQLAPGSPLVHRSLAEVHSTQGRFEAAVAELKRSIDLDPADASAFGMLGIQYRALGQVDDAESAFRQSVALRPNNWNAYNALGSFYYSQGKYSEAERAFRTEVQILPTQVMGYNNLGGVLVVLNRCSEAVNVFRQSIAIKPSAGAYTNLGNCEFNQGHYQEAAGAMESAVTLNPKEHLLWRNLGDVYKMLPGREDDAKKSYHQAVAAAVALLKVNPRDARTLASIALYWSKLGDRDKTQDFIAQADRLGSNDLTVTFNTALACELAGSRKQALVRLKSALDGGYAMERVNSAPELASLRQSSEFQQVTLNSRRGAKP